MCARTEGTIGTFQKSRARYAHRDRAIFPGLYSSTKQNGVDSAVDLLGKLRAAFLVMEVIFLHAPLA